jgi:hypothetical protein
MSTRHKWARLFLGIGVLAWIPYMISKYLFYHDVSMTPYLAVHLFGVIPGTLLRRGPETLTWIKNQFVKERK